jgi:hypothetical protein
VGPASGGWYGVGDIGDDGCEKTGAVLENLADWAEYSLLGDAFGVAPVLPVSWELGIVGHVRLTDFCSAVFNSNTVKINEADRFDMMCDRNTEPYRTYRSSSVRWSSRASSQARASFDC